jgi:hypothetical protein
MQSIEDSLSFKKREAAIMSVAASALAEVQDDLGRCDALLSLLASMCEKK